MKKILLILAFHRQSQGCQVHLRYVRHRSQRDPDACCICAGFDWAYDLTQIAEAPVERDNIGYVADTYPVICTEIGFCLPEERGAHVPVKDNGEYGPAITSYFAQKGISFTVWCFDPQWAPMLIEDWTFTPTTQGKFFKAYLESHSDRD